MQLRYVNASAKYFLELPPSIREQIIGVVLEGYLSVHISYSMLRPNNPQYARAYGDLDHCTLGLGEGATNIF